MTKIELALAIICICPMAILLSYYAYCCIKAKIDDDNTFKEIDRKLMAKE